MLSTINPLKKDFLSILGYRQIHPYMLERLSILDGEQIELKMLMIANRS